MIRALTILAAIVALAVSASPVSAGSGWPDGLSQNGDLPTGLTGTEHAAGMTPDFGIYLSFPKAPLKPRGMLDNPASGGF